MERLLSDAFKGDLLTGHLNPLLRRILDDNTLMLAIREGYINVYYRGGNILRLTETKTKHEYEAFFDENYVPDESFQLPNSPSSISSETDMRKWLDSFPARKQIMDCWLTTVVQKTEKEFQQIVVRENNYSQISNATEYFIADIELSDSERGARYDLLAFKWTSKERRADNVRLALIEMKYGENALKGDSGIIAHLKQFDKLLRDPVTCEKLCNMAAEQINQLNDLGLILHTKSAGRNFTVKKDRFEVIFLFANHNPRSKILLSALESTEFSSFAAKMSEYCDIRFFIASSAGYGMHGACMLGLDEYIKLLKNMHQR